MLGCRMLGQWQVVFFAGECCFDLKMTAECFLLDFHRKKCTFMNSESPKFCGGIGPNGIRINVIESRRKFRKIECSGILQESVFESSAKMF